MLFCLYCIIHVCYYAATVINISAKLSEKLTSDMPEGFLLLLLKDFLQHRNMLKKCFIEQPLRLTATLLTFARI